MADGDADEAARQALAIQQFMLGGSAKPAAASEEQRGGGSGNTNNDNSKSSGKKKKKKKKRGKSGGGGGGGGKPPQSPQPSTPAKSQLFTPPSRGGKVTATPSSSSSSPSSIDRKQQQRIRNMERQYWRMYRSIFAIVKDEWLDIDDQLEAVVTSIDNIRGRLPMENNLINAIRIEEEWEAQKTWDGYGLGYSTRREDNFALSVEDVQLALGHDLEQHEKMLAACRALMSNLSETQDAMGRKLDDLMQHHFESDGDGDEMTSISPQALVDEATQVYSMLSLELYRKQTLVHLLFDSVTNDMLEGDEGPLKNVHFGGAEEGDSKISSKKAASLCCKEWPRRSRHSCVDTVVLNKSLRRCEGKPMG